MYPGRQTDLRPGGGDWSGQGGNALWYARRYVQLKVRQPGLCRFDGYGSWGPTLTSKGVHFHRNLSILYSFWVSLCITHLSLRLPPFVNLADGKHTQIADRLGVIFRRATHSFPYQLHLSWRFRSVRSETPLHSCLLLERILFIPVEPLRLFFLFYRPRPMGYWIHFTYRSAAVSLPLPGECKQYGFNGVF